MFDPFEDASLSSNVQRFKSLSPFFFVDDTVGSFSCLGTALPSYWISVGKASGTVSSSM